MMAHSRTGQLAPGRTVVNHRLWRRIHGYDADRRRALRVVLESYRTGAGFQLLVKQTLSIRCASDNRPCLTGVL